MVCEREPPVEQAGRSKVAVGRVEDRVIHYHSYQWRRTALNRDVRPLHHLTQPKPSQRARCRDVVQRQSMRGL
jgi:hypothetical protein